MHATVQHHDSAVLQALKDLCIYYGGDPNQFDDVEFFGSIRQFAEKLECAVLPAIATYRRCTIVVYRTRNIIVVPPVAVEDNNHEPFAIAYVNSNLSTRVHREGDGPNLNEPDLERFQPGNVMDVHR